MTVVLCRAVGPTRLNPRIMSLRYCGRLQSRLDWVLGTPGIEPTFQGCRIESKRAKLLHHTGAGRFVRSSTVCDDEAVCCLPPRPLDDSVRQYPYTSRNPRPVVLISRAGTHIQNLGWIGPRQKLVKPSG